MTRTGIKKINNCVLPLLLCLISPGAIGSGLAIPNTFTPGTKAKANDVNSNFMAVTAAVNDNQQQITNTDTRISNNATSINTNAAAIGINAINISTNSARINTHSNNIAQNTANNALNSSRITTTESDIVTNRTDIDANTAILNNISAPIQILSNGAPIGKFLGTTAFQSGNNWLNAILYALTWKGYYYMVNINGQVVTQNVTAVYFTSADCSGQAYVAVGNSDADFYNTQGFIVSGGLNNRNQFFYKPSGSSPTELITVSSILSNGSCNLNSINTTAHPVYPNNSGITGLPDSLSTTISLI